MNKTKRLIPILALCGILIAGAAPSGKPTDRDKENKDARSHDLALQRNLKTFNSMVKALEENYVDSIRIDEAFDAAIDAMLGTVDPYTEFFNAEDHEKLERLTTGTYGGIGAYLLTFDGATYISEPVYGAPAQRAGLRAGDKILRVDSVDVLGMDGDKVSKLLRGNPSTQLTVRVARPYETDSIHEFTFTREKVSEQSVPYAGVIDGSTGFIRISQFVEDTPKGVEAALREFMANPDVKEVVIDLRGNGGGVVESAVDIAGFFLPKGTEVMTMKGKTRASEKTYKTTRKPLMPDIPLAVLIDGGSASASEILAGALQDLDRAVLVGSNSFGKGLVQSTSQLPYDAFLKVTIAKYYIPSGRLIQALDYSRRNPDGSVARVPDSLTNVYHTRNGREVRDGGGLKPDTTVDWGRNSQLLYDLITNQQVFKYANKFQAENPSIPAPGEFEVTDEIYSDFCAFVDTTRIHPDRGGMLYLDGLRKTVKEEGYANDSITALLDSLAPMLRPDLQRDLRAKREEIIDYLAPELVGRYYYEKGRTRNALTRDKGLQTAVSILRDSRKYNDILHPKRKK